MAEVKDPPKKAKPASAIPAFDLPKFEIPKIDFNNLASMDVPVAVRELAEKSVAQAKETYEKIKFATEETTDMIEDTYVTAAKGVADFNLKALEAARTNVNAAFDYARDVLQVKSLSEAVELTSAHARKQFEAITTQTKDLSALAQKVATDTAEPMKESVNKVMKTS